MTVTFDGNKICKAYEDFVKDPSDRGKQKAFNKVLDGNIAKAAVKVHQRLVSATCASQYNQLYRGDNSIQIKSGQKDKESVILKVRIQDSYRKFFYFYEVPALTHFGITKDWVGQFNDVTHIEIHDVNKHDYS